MELGVSHEQSLSSLTPIVDNIFDKYNKNLVPIRSLSDHDNYIYQHFQDSEKMHQIDPESELTTMDDNSLYPYLNNDIE